MKRKRSDFSDLRSRAVKLLEQQPGGRLEVSPKDSEKLLEELRIHQIELEMQNEELRLATEAAEQSRAKFIDLYDSAPVGYLTLNENGVIIEANLTSAKLLGLARSQILNHRLTDFVDPDFQDILYFHLLKVRQSSIQESCELKLRHHGDEPFFAHLESIAILHAKSLPAEIRISFMNVHQSRLNTIALKESADRNEMLLNMLPQSTLLIDRDRKVLAANLLAKKKGAVIGKVWNRSGSKEQSRQQVPATLEFTDQQGLGDTSLVSEDTPHQQRLVTVIEDSNDAVMLLKMNGNILAWNRRAEEMYGYPASEALRISIFDLIPFGLKLKTRQLLADIRTGVLIKPFETSRIARDGTVLDVCMKVTRIAQGKKIVAIATTERDVTEHNRWFASLHDLPRRIIMAQEKERSRISQVLHSEFGQSLIALKLFTVISASALPVDNLPTKLAFNSIKTQLDKIINETRDLAHELSPPGLRYAGLVPAIKDLVESQMMKKNLDIRFFHKNISRVHFKKIDIIIYRILQEALQNIFKHAHATRARVNAVIKNSVLTLEVSDNGRGFDPSVRTANMGLGLALMKEQASLMNGSLSLESRPGKGTTIKVTVPIREKKKI